MKNIRVNEEVNVKTLSYTINGYLAADRVVVDCWKELVAIFMLEYQRDGDLSRVRKDWLEAEREIKAREKIDTMPSKYRTAKSVIFRAAIYNVDLLDSIGFPRSKSEVELDIKLQINMERGLSSFKPEDRELVRYTHRFIAKWNKSGNTGRKFATTVLVGSGVVEWLKANTTTSTSEST